MLNALIFDIDGTVADTESVHRDAFNAAFRQSDLDWHWDEALYTRLLLVAGGKERLLHYWREIDPVRAADSRTPQVIDRIHAIKTREYEQRVGGGRLALRPGILRLIREAHQAGLPMAIATTTTPANVAALLSTPLGEDWRSYFVAICDGSVPGLKKPAPDIYFTALTALQLPPDQCLAFEDSENGLRAATAAGIPTLITPTTYTAMQDFTGALLVVPHLGDPATPMLQRLPGTDQRWADLAALRRWHDGIFFEAS